MHHGSVLHINTCKLYSYVFSYTMTMFYPQFLSISRDRLIIIDIAYFFTDFDRFWQIFPNNDQKNSGAGESSCFMLGRSKTALAELCIGGELASGQ